VRSLTATYVAAQMLFNKLRVSADIQGNIIREVMKSRQAREEKIAAEAALILAEREAMAA
jgi:hypothetical protein